MTKKLGMQSFYFAAPPTIVSSAAVVGPLEGAGPLKGKFDKAYEGVDADEDSYEKAERRMIMDACYIALKKINTPPENVEYFLAGDLLNQIISAEFAALQLAIPFLGIYGACSTAVEGLILGSVLIDGGFGNLVLAACSSHYNTAERQYRFPNEYGTQHKPVCQHTVTGAGAGVLATGGLGPVVTHATVGKVIDMACTDALNMGAAMAPAAADTINRHLLDLGRTADDYDLILTGDLGSVGYELTLQELKDTYKSDIKAKYQDCGLLIYDRATQPEVMSGGSGCACSATVFYSDIYQRLMTGKLKRIMLVGTGALMSPTSLQQGENIPCIAHAISVEMR